MTTGILIDHVREHAMEFLVRLEPLPPFQGPEGIALFAQIVEMVGQCLNHAVAGRHKQAEEKALKVKDSFLPGISDDLLHTEIEEAFSELCTVVGAPIERLH